MLLQLLLSLLLAGQAAAPAGVSVFARGEANSSAYRIPGLLTVNGVVLAFAAQRTQGCADHKSGVHNLVLKRSTDMGRSFGNLSMVVDVEAVWGAAAARDGRGMGAVATNPTPVADERTGEILLFFGHTNVSMEHATHHGSGPVYEYTWVYPDATTSYVMSSTDLGLSWGQPKTVASLGAKSDLCSVTPAGGHGVQLPSGKLLVPGYHIHKCTKIDAEVVEEAHAWLSDAGGGDGENGIQQPRRWQISPGFGAGVAEQSFVPLFQAPGQLSTVRATFRVDAPSSCNCTATEGGKAPTPWPPVGGRDKCRRTATSTDEGLSWGNFWDQAALPDPGE